MGSDWFLRFEAVIDYGDRSFSVNGSHVSGSVISFGRIPSERVQKTIVDDVTYIQILNFNQNYNLDEELSNPTFVTCEQRNPSRISPSMSSCQDPAPRSEIRILIYQIEPFFDVSNRVDTIRTTSAVQLSDNTSNVINDIDYAGCFNVLYNYDATPDLNVDSCSREVCNISKLNEFSSRLDMKEQVREDFNFLNLQITHDNFICEDNLNLSVQEEKNVVLGLNNLENNNTEIVSDSTSFLGGVRAIAFSLEGLTDHKR